MSTNVSQLRPGGMRGWAGGVPPRMLGPPSGARRVAGAPRLPDRCTSVRGVVMVTLLGTASRTLKLSHSPWAAAAPVFLA
jgi:hypothetical protein